ncbi:hypothetical protein LOTGIDRAFT_216792 [Lottia gigantea]|uniref:Uridylate-specific endoribonuclease n=1 Tax=Lottia gigantea TaxID=225164 RepID=V4ABB3_LOTGI|nr:hypothetical protein LOTGIDRAFT_216792 [Lottia gigantea]ESO92350.1 hypothetical protein LOTGIDRAFT_216792 [Lottia gigantea]
MSEYNPDPELSEILTKLWEMDENKCYPGKDYEIELQGFVKSTRDTSRDFSRENLIQNLDEEDIFSRPTYKAFRALLDNYEMDCSEQENITWEEKQENYEFLNAILDTDVMKTAHQYLVEKGKASSDVGDFKKKLHDIWFRMFRRRGCRGNDSSSFEHVFVGEGREDSMIGLHNWIQFYLQEKAGHINYNGYFRRETVKDDEYPRLIALQFTYKGEKAKPMCSCFLGTSPEFEIAAYTVGLLMGYNGTTDCQIGEYETEVTIYSFGGYHKKLSTAYITAARM